MKRRERPELVVSLKEKRVVRTVERQPCRARLGKQLARVLREKRELRQIRPAGDGRERDQLDSEAGELLEQAIPGAELVPDVGVAVTPRGESCRPFGCSSQGQAATRYFRAAAKRNLVAIAPRSHSRRGRPGPRQCCRLSAEDATIGTACRAHAPDGRLRNRRASVDGRSAHRRPTSPCPGPTAEPTRSPTTPAAASWPWSSRATTVRRRSCTKRASQSSTMTTATAASLWWPSIPTVRRRFGSTS